jgi:hypothetical protein
MKNVFIFAGYKRYMAAMAGERIRVFGLVDGCARREFHGSWIQQE